MQSLLMNVQLAGIGDYIFLAVIVISAIAQIIGKNRKKLLESEEMENRPHKPHPMDDDEYEQPQPKRPVFTIPFDPFDQVDTIPAEEGTPSVTGRKAQPKAKSKPKKFETVAERMAAQYNAAQIAEMEKRIKEGQRMFNNSIKSEETGHGETGRKGCRFNLREAVIQSEILNRKYS